MLSPDYPDTRGLQDIDEYDSDRARRLAGYATPAFRKSVEELIEARGIGPAIARANAQIEAAFGADPCREKPHRGTQ